MPAHAATIWKLSYPELARLCKKLAHTSSSVLDPAIREEAARIHDGWSEALALDLHKRGGRERQECMMLALRMRTIELVLKSKQTSD
jgi:carboxylesterase type B